MSDKPHVLTPEEIEKLPTKKWRTIPLVVEDKVPFGEWNKGTHASWVGSNYVVEAYEMMMYEKPSKWYEFGKTRRFWSGMPTAKQSKETPWDSEST